MTKAHRQFTAVYQRAGAWYLGWVEEIPGVNTQGKTLKETKENLKEALQLIVEATVSALTELVYQLQQLKSK